MTGSFSFLFSQQQSSFFSIFPFFSFRVLLCQSGIVIVDFFLLLCRIDETYVLFLIFFHACACCEIAAGYSLNPHRIRYTILPECPEF